MPDPKVINIREVIARAQLRTQGNNIVVIIDDEDPIPIGEKINFRGEEIEFQIASGDLRWKYQSQAGWQDLITLEKYNEFTLTPSDIQNSYISISPQIKNPQSLKVFIENIGLMAERGIDYNHTSTQIYWAGYKLNNLLEEGDKLNISYY